MLGYCPLKKIEISDEFGWKKVYDSYKEAQENLKISGISYAINHGNSIKRRSDKNILF